MKFPLLSALLLLGTVTIYAQQHKLEKVWETAPVVAVPESVLPDRGTLYVSLIDGPSWEADGKGGVARLSPDGKKYDSAWITGLQAPKGMGRTGNRLYVADMKEVVVIDIPKGKIEKKIAIDGDADNVNCADIGYDRAKRIVYVPTFNGKQVVAYRLQ